VPDTELSEGFSGDRVPIQSTRVERAAVPLPEENEISTIFSAELNYRLQLHHYPVDIVPDTLLPCGNSCAECPKGRQVGLYGKYAAMFGEQAISHISLILLLVHTFSSDAFFCKNKMCSNSS
jgi:hypothetical protein